MPKELVSMEEIDKLIRLHEQRLLTAVFGGGAYQVAKRVLVALYELKRLRTGVPLEGTVS